MSNITLQLLEAAFCIICAVLSITEKNPTYLVVAMLIEINDKLRK